MSLKKIFKGAGKSFKKFAKTKLGKAVLIGAALWVGWQFLGKAAAGAAKTGAAGAAEGAAAAATPGATAATATTAGEGALSNAMASGIPANTAVDVAAGSAVPAADIAIGAVPQAGMKSMALDVGGKSVLANVPEVAAASQPGGILSRAGAAVKGGANWMGANPIPTLVAGNMIQGFAQPDPYEEWLKQRSYEQANSNYAGVYGDGRATQIEMPTAGLLTQANKQFLPGV
jgi:hypothetical protein